MLKPDKVPSWRRGGVPLLRNKLLAIDSYWEKENQVLRWNETGFNNHSRADPISKSTTQQTRLFEERKGHEVCWVGREGRIWGELGRGENMIKIKLYCMKFSKNIVKQF